LSLIVILVYWGEDNLVNFCILSQGEQYRGGEKVNKKYFLVLVLSFVALAILPVCNAVVTPVEIERVKDVGFVRIRGNHNTRTFLLNYVNLSPQTQEVKFERAIVYPKQSFWTTTVDIVQPGDSLDISASGGYSYILEFSVSVRIYMMIGEWTNIVADSVIIPPVL
jgi:hypothetical protein